MYETYSEIVLKYLLGPLLALACLLAVRDLIKDRERSVWAWLLVGLTMLYPLGKLCAYWQVGPNAFRWWMGDFGSIAFYGMFVAQWVAVRRTGTYDVFRVWLPVGATVLAAACILEGLQYVAQAQNSGGLSARWDPIDLLSYFLGFAVATLLVWLHQRQYGRRLAEWEAQVAMAKQERSREQAQRAESRRPRGKQKKRRHGTSRR